MRSSFSLAQESAEYQEALTNYRGGEQVNDSDDLGDYEVSQEILSEAHNEGGHFDSLSEGQDKLEAVKDEVQTAMENGGLTPKGLFYLQISLRNIVGKRNSARKLPSMESVDSTTPMHLTKIALEGIKETLGEFWAAIKNQLGKFWKMTKDWYIKTFDVANNLIARAKALGEKANTLATSATEKTFTFSGVDSISVAGQVKDPAICIKGYEDLKKLIDSILVNVSAQNQNDKSDSILSAVNSALTMARSNLTKAAGATPSNNLFSDNAIAAAVTASYEGDAPKYSDIVGTTPINDPEMAKKLGVDAATAKIFMSQPLPGNRSFFVILPVASLEKPDFSSTDLAYKYLDDIKLVRMTFSDSSSKPRTSETEGDVKTLASSQIAQIATITEEMGETILKFKKEYDARDRYIQKIVKGYDQIFKELDGTEVKHDDSSQAATPPANPPAAGAPAQAATPAPTSSPVDAVDKFVRKMSQTMLGLFKKNMTISGAAISLATKSASAYLSYGEKSLSQYGKA